MSGRDRRTRPHIWRPSPGTVTEAETACLLALLTLPKMGPVRLDALLAERDPTSAWDAVRTFSGDLRGLPDQETLRGNPQRLFEAWRAEARRLDPAELLGLHRAHGAEAIAYGSERYPVRLLADPEPPLVVFVRGDPTVLGRRTVAIVGSRRCTPYGSGVAREWGGALAAAGVCVVSGLARGVDAAAHVGALEAEGASPVGVVGTGLDVVYPHSSRRLWAAVADNGLLLSEAPLGAEPEPWRFPARNRIIAGLADAVVVVESEINGGSMLTATDAAERDRPVFAVPGSVRSPMSSGPNRLLGEGAFVATEVADVLGVLGLSSAAAVENAPRSEREVVDRGGGLDPDLEAVLARVGWEAVAIERVAGQLQWSLGRTFLAVEELLGSGVLVQDGGVVRRR